MLLMVSKTSFSNHSGVTSWSKCDSAPRVLLKAKKNSLKIWEGSANQYFQNFNFSSALLKNTRKILKIYKNLKKPRK
jgi:hypothetical protein